ncbi:hypothetical protein [Dyadobacter arcticus]|uniref:Uncharacterized protein n=1 Tax=Dyadobacter arcticus TaxID=1078754 RepID=A0ABX0UQ48_9BACT|nr:hypothetical protein [Dyadobacter arcticus]NIJ53800.1 hypothetical protein [Dyadobacter arcticus]
MKAIKNISAGLAGAVALNILHETAKRFYSKAPRVDLIGEEALSKSLNALGISSPSRKNLFGLTLAGDLISNSMYYSMVPVGKSKNLIFRGAAYGLAAGIGALTLTKPMGLDDDHVNKTVQTKVLTVAWYLVGGLVAAFVAQKIGE